MASQPPGSPQHGLIEARVGIRPARPRDPTRVRSVTTRSLLFEALRCENTRGAANPARAPHELSHRLESRRVNQLPRYRALILPHVVSVTGVLLVVPQTSNQSRPSFIVFVPAMPRQAEPNDVSAWDEAEVEDTIERTGDPVTVIDCVPSL